MSDGDDSDASLSCSISSDDGDGDEVDELIIFEPTWRDLLTFDIEKVVHIPDDREVQVEGFEDNVVFFILV